VGFKELCPGSFPYATFPAFLPRHKNIYLTITYELLDFPTVGENTCSSRTDINRPLTEKKGDRERERERE
jgi:hypothetical protein